MAKPPATQETTNLPVLNEDGSVSVDAFLHDRAEARIESGYIPYFTEEEKDKLCADGTALWILGARWNTSDKFRDKNTGEWRRNCELSITSDVDDPRKSGIWGGLPDTPYWQHFEPKITGLLDAAEKAGSTNPRIGPLYAHQRMYQNEYGEFPSYDFLGTPQDNSVASSSTTNGASAAATDGDDEPPF